MTVLHNFYEYLPVSQNWAYNLIRHTPVDKLVIYAERYLKNNFYLPNALYLNDGLQGLGDVKLGFTASSNFERAAGIVILIAEKILQLRQSYKYLNDIHVTGVDIVHSHFATIAIKKSEIVKKSGCKHVVSFYGYDYEMVPRSDRRVLAAYRQLFGEADAFVCEGGHGAKILANYGCPPDKIHIIKLGIDSAMVASTPRKKNRNQLHLVQIANFTEKKGHIYSLRAFAKALPLAPNMRLTLVGSRKREEDRDTERDIYQAIQEYGLQDYVELVPKIDFADLSSYLRKFDVFIHPSCYAKNCDCEGGAPVVLLDAQAAGLPVISTYHCDIPSEVIDKVTGLLSDEKDVDNIAESIVKFYTMSEAAYHIFSRACLHHVRTEYNLSDSGHKLAKLYGSLL